MPLPPSPQSTERHVARQTQRGGLLERRGPGIWRYVGDTDFTVFVNGENAAPSAAIPNPMPLRIRWTLGAGLEIQGDVTNLEPGDVVCNFPSDYRLDHDVPVTGHDDDGNYVPCRIYATDGIYAAGDFVYGVV